MDEVKQKDQQYFPTYHLSPEATEVSLREYELAASTLAAEEKVLNLSTSLLVGIIGVAFAFYKDNASTINSATQAAINNTAALFATAAMFALITFATTSYFVDTRKSVVYAGRKLIILRRMMGLSYGSIELVLPSRRIEGANEPYHLAMFHGWLSAKAIAIYCISISSSIIVWIFSPILLSKFDVFKTLAETPWLHPLIGLSWATLVATYYRLHLLDQYETWWRLFVVFAASIIRAPLVKDFEYIIYRARLSAIEAKRVGVPLKVFPNILLELEDRDFRRHRGISPRALVASFTRYLERGKISGGSTITQQLVRTLFIKRDDLFPRRKIFELLLSLWFDRTFSKDDLLEIYICSVRYERGVMGVLEASSHFFPTKEFRNLTRADAFFLIERVSNIRSRLIVGKIATNISYLLAKKLLTMEEVNSILNIYKKQIDAGRILSPLGDVEAIRNSISSQGAAKTGDTTLTKGLFRLAQSIISYSRRRHVFTGRLFRSMVLALHGFEFLVAGFLLLLLTGAT